MPKNSGNYCPVFGLSTGSDTDAGAAAGNLLPDITGATGVPGLTGKYRGPFWPQALSSVMLQARTRLVINVVFFKMSNTV